MSRTYRKKIRIDRLRKKIQALRRACELGQWSLIQIWLCLICFMDCFEHADPISKWVKSRSPNPILLCAMCLTLISLRFRGDSRLCPHIFRTFLFHVTSAWRDLWGVVRLRDGPEIIVNVFNVLNKGEQKSTNRWKHYLTSLSLSLSRACKCVVLSGPR